MSFTDHQDLFTDLFLKFLSKCQDLMFSILVKILLVGDFNIDKTPFNRVLSNITTIYSSSSTICNYTREFNGSQTIIDNIFSNIEKYFESQVIFSAISDHHA